MHKIQKQWNKRTHRYNKKHSQNIKQNFKNWMRKLCNAPARYKGITEKYDGKNCKIQIIHEVVNVCK